MKMIVMNKRMRPLGVLLAISALLVSAGCGAVTAGPGAAAGHPGQLSIVTAFYPFQFIAERVAGSHATVTTLTQPGAEPHDVELTPRQVGAVSTADLVVYERTFQAAVDEAVDQSGAADVLDTASVVPLKPLAAAEPGNGGLDPHVWLDPANMVTIADAVAKRLSALDAKHASTYAANAAALGSELHAVDQEYTAGLADCRRTEFITTHTAFGYLAGRYGLTQVGITGLSPDAEPSPARVAKVQADAREHGVTTIFYETLVSPAIAQSIAGDLGLVTDVLDPIEGITETSRGRDYVAVMRSNLAALEKANGCA
jgi:zinc transport system substrate-binding protein